MATYYGNTDGTSNSSFRIACEYTSSNLGNGYYQYRYRFYIQVTKGNFYGTSVDVSWSGSNVTIRGSGKYGYSGYSTKNVAYGSAFTLGSTAFAQYTASSTYRSSISGSTTISTAPKPKYTVKYNANGGSGAPGNQTKTYGKTLTLSSTKPTRTNYTFKGWGTSASSTTVSYAAGASYTTNADITLYAIWELAYSKPVVTNLIADRCNASGELAEDGQYAKVVFNWQIDEVNSGGLADVVIQWKRSTDTGWSSATAVSGGEATSGTVSKVVGGNALDTEYDYDIQIVVTDAKGNATYSIVLPAMKYIIDFLAGGNGIRIGAPANRQGFRDQFNTVFSNGCANLNLESDELNDSLDPDATLENVILTNVNTPNSGYMYIQTMFNEEKSKNSNRAQFAIPYNSNGSMYHRYFYEGVWSEWRRHTNADESQNVLWTGAYYMVNTHTATLSQKVSEQRNGIVLVFSAYANDGPVDIDFNVFFIPKEQVALHNGKSYDFLMSRAGFEDIACKYLFIYDDKIIGAGGNATSGTGASGIKYNNGYYVLRKVIGV